MRVHTKIVIRITTGQVVYEEGYEYHGPVAQCKGGGGSTNTISEGDKEYNARMATIAEAQQKMAEGYEQFWTDTYKPMEIEQVAANRELIPQQTALSLAQLTADQQLLPQQTEAKQQLLTMGMDGVNGEQAAREASSAVAQQFAGIEGASLRELSRRGLLTPGQSAVDLENLGIEQAKASASAQTGARNKAKTDSFNMISTALNTP